MLRPYVQTLLELLCITQNSRFAVLRTTSWFYVGFFRQLGVLFAAQNPKHVCDRPSNFISDSLVICRTTT